MKFANYIQREVVNPVDLQILDKTYNTLEQGHQAAIQAVSSLQTEMAKLDLNETESAWRQQKIDEIKSTLENNSYMGNAYHALDDITKVGGDLFSNPELLGRLQAQQDYKTYMAKLDASNLSEDKKEYFREQNPYYYQDKVDVNTGKIIGGTKWEPIDRFVNQYDYTKLYEQAVRMTAKKKGANQTIYYKDAEGNFTPDIRQSVDKLPYYKKDISYEELRAQDIEETLNALLETNPEAKASIAQDYKISAWKHNNFIKENPNQLVIDEFTDDNGVQLSQDEYIKKMFDPLYKTSSYKYYDSNITELDGLKLKTDKRTGTNKSTTTEPTDLRFVTISGPYMKSLHSNISSTLATKNAAIETLQGYFSNVNAKFNPTDIEGSIKSLNDEYAKKRQIIPKEIYDAYITYQKSSEDYSQITSMIGSKEDKDAITFASALEAGVDLTQISNNNKHKQVYEKWKNDLLNDDKNGWDININPKQFTLALNELTEGDNNRLNELGIEIKTNTETGNKYIHINKDKGDNLYFVMKSIEPFIEYKNQRTPDVSKTGTFTSMYQQQYIGNSTFYPEKTFIKTIDDILSSIDKNVTSKIEVAGTSEPLVGTTDVMDIIYGEGIITNENAHKIYNNLLSAAQGQNLEMSVAYDGGIGDRVVDSKQRYALLKLANAINNNSSLGNVVINVGQETLDSYISVNINPQNTEAIKQVKSLMKENGITNNGDDIQFSYELKIPNLFNSSEKQKLMNNTNFKSGHEYSIKKQSGVYHYDICGNITLDRADLNGSHIISMNGEPIMALDNTSSRNAYAAGNRFNNLKYIINTKNGKPLTDNDKVYIATEVMSIVKSLLPTEQNNNANSANELDDIGVVMFNNIIKQLNSPLIQ